MKHLWVMLCLLCTMMVCAMSCGDDDNDSNSSDGGNNTDGDGGSGDGDGTDESGGTSMSALTSTGPCAEDVATTA